MANYFYPLESGREAWKSKISPSWTITEQTTASGRRRALIEQAYPKWQINLEYKALNNEEAQALQGFYCLRKGGFEPFYFKCYEYHKAEKQRLGTNTDGTYQCVANLGGYVEPVSYVEKLTVYINGVKTTNYTLNNGRISLAAGSGTVTADYEYYLKVHFVGALTISNVFEDVNNVSVTLEGVR